MLTLCTTRHLQLALFLFCHLHMICIDLFATSGDTVSRTVHSQRTVYLESWRSDIGQWPNAHFRTLYYIYSFLYTSLFKPVRVVASLVLRPKLVLPAHFTS